MSGNHFALGIVFDLAVLVLVGKPGDGRQVAAFGDFLAGEIKFLAAHPVNRRRRLEVSVGNTIVCAPTKPILVSGFCALMASATLQSFFSDGVDVLMMTWSKSLAMARHLARSMLCGGQSSSSRIGRERRGLREPGRIPIAGDFAPRLVTRAGAAVKAVKLRRGKIKCSAHEQFMFG